MRRAIAFAFASCARDRERMERLHTATMLAVIEIALSVGMTAVYLATTVSVLVLIREAGTALFYVESKREVIGNR